MSDRKEILLINRDREFLRKTSDFLGHAGYTVHTEMEMRGALTALSAHPVALIICDKDLQDVSGYDFLNFIKKDPLRESIPFIFLVPANDQGRPFKAFELGAIDFLVYPMDRQELVKRTLEILPLEDPEITTASTEVSETDSHDLQSSQAVSLPPPQTSRSQRIDPLPSLDIEVSRDGELWMPGRVKKISPHGILVETALFGKSGVSLMIRFKLPEDSVIVMGRIKHVSFDNFQAPAGMAIEIGQDKVWQKIFSDLSCLKTNGLSGAEKNRPDISSTSASIPEETVMMPQQMPEIPAVDQTGRDSTWEIREPSYDDRFYDSLVGKQLDNYLIFTFIGSGSMGGVFQGWDIALEREVAMKVIACELSSQVAFRNKFIKKARTISRLDHPNIARIYYVGYNDDILYYAMEFIDGETLADMIRRHRTIKTLEGVDYLITICKALEFVRKMNIIHRDIKPENIMVNNEGVIKIVDFGVAKIADSGSPGKQLEAIMGSPLYMSPDCLAGRPLDHRSDIYSLGATFYHAFTGHPPFEGDNIQDVLDQHLHRPLTQLKKKNSKIPTVLGKIIEKMMAKEPRERFQNYESVINAFKSLRFRALSLIRNRL